MDHALKVLRDREFAEYLTEIRVAWDQSPGDVSERVEWECRYFFNKGTELGHEYAVKYKLSQVTYDLSGLKVLGLTLEQVTKLKGFYEMQCGKSAHDI